MRIYAISDLHLSGACPKPMDIFGPNWEGHWDRVRDFWKQRVSPDDYVLIGGDISWAMNMEEAAVDLREIGELPGKKVILRGNHDYWWGSLSKVCSICPSDMVPVQNNSIRAGHVLITGTRGWSLASSADTAQDEKIVQREAQRLELSLQHAKKQMAEGDSILCMMHFPPFNDRREPSVFTEILEAAGVKQVCYGHLHGPHLSAVFEGELRGVMYRMTSCDYLRCDPTPLAEEDEYGELHWFLSRNGSEA